MKEFIIETAGHRSRITVHGNADVPEAGVAGELRRAVLLSDTNTSRYVEPLLRNSRERITPVKELVLPPGEEEKSLENLDRLLGAALEARLSRKDLFIVLGGGVLTDLGAFAASVYLRGVGVELFPTTLLGMVDAAVGGKTGTNYRGYKNMIGTFYPAREVRIYPHYLSTLPEGEYRSGLAEVIKAALLGDCRLFELLRDKRGAVLARDPEVVRELIERAVAVKVAVVREDLHEGGRRAVLNLGHTFAHALESVARFGRYSHGEAVAWGIGRALELGRRLGITDDGYRETVLELLEAYGYQLAPVSYDPEDLIDAMGQDKKREGDDIRFILQRRLGETEISPVDRQLVRDALVSEA